MTSADKRKLHFRRQYLLSPSKVDCPFVNNYILINDSAHLYSHVDLVVTQQDGNGRKLVLLGDLFDYQNINYTNQNILSDLIQYDFNGLLSALSRYSGRFVVIYNENESIKLIHDAASSRKIYYTRYNKGVYCASQPHLIARVLNLHITKDRERLEFYTGSPEIFEKLHNSNIANTTCYDDVYQVRPNHYFDYNSGMSVRYWPNTKRECLPVDEVVSRCSVMIKGFMESICNRYQVMLPVTAGKDSRLLLAASYNHKDHVYYYINKRPHMNDSHHDLIIPGRLLPKLGLKLNVVDHCNSVDSEFEKIYFENNPFASKHFLPVIYNYYQYYSDRINLPGTFSASALRIFSQNGKPIDENLLASLIRVEKFGFTRKYFSDWLNECIDICNNLNYDVLNLLYWEERMGNWGTEIQINKDIAQDEIIPYNSRLFIETLISAPECDREKPDFKVIREITRKLWPDTMQEPYNATFRKRTFLILKKVGINKLVLKIYNALKSLFKFG